MSLISFYTCRNIFCTVFVWIYQTTYFLTDGKSSKLTFKYYVRYNM